MTRRSLSFSREEILFLSAYLVRKGIKGGISGLLSQALHSYVARNKCRGLVPPWEKAENAKDAPEEAGTEKHTA